MICLFLLALSATMPEGAFADRCREIVGDRGAVAVMDLKTGRLIVATDPELLFTKRFPPGSLAKLLTGLVALEKRTALPDSFPCRGWEVRGKDTLYCSQKYGHGQVDFDRALTLSCNLYFQTLAEKLTAQDLVAIYRKLGLTSRVGVDLPGEMESIVGIPATDSAKLAFAIGQGSLIQVTPVAMLSLISGFATGGQLLRPRLSPGSAEVLASFPSHRALGRMAPLLRNVVKQGTGKEANISTVAVAGKTGSATVLDNWVTHGWFIGFAPYEAPQIALVVFLDRGEGKDAARLAGLIFSDYFKGAYAEY